jgi:predicted N-formylglutamate amidohydrolase
LPPAAALRSSTSNRDAHPVELIPGSNEAGLLIVCDHASNEVPPDLGTLGLPEETFARHIAYDIGAAAVTRALARRLKAPAVLSRFSRLVIDPNRGRDDPTLVMRLSDGAVVPGNARVGADEVEERIRRFYDPYDRAIAESLDRLIAAGASPALVSVHSFTPIWRGVPRPWHAGILYDVDERLARPLLEGLRRDPTLVVGENEPYDGALDGDTVNRHATRRGLSPAMIEIRQDLIATEAGAEAWAERFADLLAEALADPARRAASPQPTRTRERLRRA